MKTKVDHAAACRFFTPEDACRLALAAYYGASRDIEPPAGESWVVDGMIWSSTCDFAAAFLTRVEREIFSIAAEKGVSCATFTGSIIEPHENPFLRPQGNDLPPPDNAADNAAIPGPR